MYTFSAGLWTATENGGQKQYFNIDYMCSLFETDHYYSKMIYLNMILSY